MGDVKSETVLGAIQLGFVIAVVLIAVGLSEAVKPKKSGRLPVQDLSGETARPNVLASVPERVVFTPTVQTNGVVRSRAQADVAPQVSGRVVKVGEAFKSGNAVSAGEVLFEIDPADYLLAVEQAEASIASASSDLALLKAEADIAIAEWQQVFPDKEISELAARRPQIAAATARLRGARAARKSAELNLSRTKVLAPLDARVLSTTLDIGQIVTANQPVGTIFGLDSIEVTASLSTQQLDVLKPLDGLAATFTMRGDRGAELAGQVVRVDAALDPRTRLATAYIRPETSEGLTVGDFVDIYLNGQQRQDVFAIPSSALATRDKVWVVDDGSLSGRTVTVLGERDGKTMVAAFDFAEGIVNFPPIEAYEGQDVTMRLTGTAIARGGSDAGAR